MVGQLERHSCPFPSVQSRPQPQPQSPSFTRPMLGPSGQTIHHFQDTPWHQSSAARSQWAAEHHRSPDKAFVLPKQQKATPLGRDSD